MSAIIAMFSSPVVRSARSACRRSCFATSATTGASESTSARTCGSSTARVPALRVLPNAASSALRKSSSLAARLKNSVSFGHRARPAALDEADAELVEQRRDRQLVGDREVHALLLGAVAQGRVVDLERGARAGTDTMCSLRCWDGAYVELRRRLRARSGRRGCAGAVDGSRGGGGASTNKKTPRGTGGLRVSGWADALLDNEGGAVHPCIVAHVTSRGHAFHPLDTLSTARARRVGRAVVRSR